MKRNIIASSQQRVQYESSKGKAPSEGRFASQNSALTPVHKENLEGGGSVNLTGKMEDDLQRRPCLRKLSLD